MPFQYEITKIRWDKDFSKILLISNEWWENDPFRQLYRIHQNPRLIKFELANFAEEYFPKMKNAVLEKMQNCNVSYNRENFF